MSPTATDEAMKRKWLQAIRDEWRAANEQHLKGRLSPPVIALHSGDSRLGFWDLATRTISISDQHLWERPWAEVVETLRHETAHQYADEVLGGSNQRPHGRDFQKTCRLLCIEPAATQQAAHQGDSAADAVKRRIRKLLALASSPNRHEAEAASAKAHKLMLAYNVRETERGTTRCFAFRHLGPGYVRIPHERRLIARILQDFYFVEVIWLPMFNVRKARWEQRIEVCGTELNVAAAKYIHAFLVEQSLKCWQRRGKPFAKGRRAPRKEYLSGFLDGVRARLESQRKDCAERSLVWIDDPALKQYFDHRHPSTVSVSSRRSSKGWFWKRGRMVGRGLVIRRPPEEDPQSLRGLVCEDRQGPSEMCKGLKNRALGTPIEPGCLEDTAKVVETTEACLVRVGQIAAVTSHHRKED